MIILLNQRTSSGPPLAKRMCLFPPPSLIFSPFIPSCEPPADLFANHESLAPPFGANRFAPASCIPVCPPMVHKKLRFHNYGIGTIIGLNDPLPVGPREGRGQLPQARHPVQGRSQGL